mgnify:CR=1 FL=1
MWCIEFVTGGFRDSSCGNGDEQNVCVLVSAASDADDAGMDLAKHAEWRRTISDRYAES